MTTATTMVGERVDSDKDDYMTKTPTARTMTTTFLTQQPTCGRMHSCQGGGVISTMMKMATNKMTMASMTTKVKAESKVKAEAEAEKEEEEEE